MVGARSPADSVSTQTRTPQVTDTHHTLVFFVSKLSARVQGGPGNLKQCAWAGNPFKKPAKEH